MEKIIYNEAYFSKLNVEFKLALKAIKKAERIVIFRHQVPDFDALGTQMGLYTWIKQSFPEKEVHFVGETFKPFIPRIFPEPEKLDEAWYDKPYLAIAVDTPTLERMSEPHLDKASCVVRFDHHPQVENWGTIISIHPDMAACSELVALMIQSVGYHYPMSKEAARFFFIGLVGDSGRFRFPEVSPMSFRIAADLLETGIDKEAIYKEMYLTTLQEFNFQKWVLTHYTVSPKGTVYYVLRDADLKELGVDKGDGKLGLSLFRDVEGITSCLSVTEDIEKGIYSLSFRSNGKAVVKVAQMFNGGGHEQAAGGKISSLDEVEKVVKALDELE